MKREPWIELVLCALCIWAASYHTPAGALARSLFGLRTRPLLAYYGSGTHAQTPAPPPPMLAAPVPPAEALAYGWATLTQLDPAELRETARRAGLDPARVTDARKGPRTVGIQLASLEKRLGSEQAAVLALFAGEEPARYACDEAGADSDLEELARALPPRYGDEVALASRSLSNGGAYALAWPLPETVRVTSPFGERQHPTLGGKRLHAGVDLGVPIGTLVRASGAGIVRRSSSDDLNGRIVIVDHGRGVVTVYCHNDELLVHTGDRIERGQPISRSGNTGRSTGPHLHYQLDLLGQPVDPLRYRAVATRAAPGGGSD